jgi:hypothetical protein
MSTTTHAPKRIDPSASLHAASCVNAHTLFLDGGHLGGIVRG